MNLIRKIYYTTHMNQRKNCLDKIKSKKIMYDKMDAKHDWMHAFVHGKCVINNHGKVKEIYNTLIKSRIKVDFTTRFVYFLDEYTII